jgi:hypothetical protein
MRYDYVSSTLQELAVQTIIQRDLLGLFASLCWLRVLKYLRIPPYTGATVQSLMDTVRSTSVVIFVVIIIYIMLSFSWTFHVSFGASIDSYKFFPSTLLTLARMLFGDFDYEVIAASSRAYGPLLLIAFLAFTGLLLMVKCVQIVC